MSWCLSRFLQVRIPNCSSFSNIRIPFHPFPYDKILDQSKLKAFAEDSLNLTKMIVSVFDRVENIVGKGAIACTSNFSFPHNVFKRLLSQTRQKVSLCGNWLNLPIQTSKAGYLINEYTGILSWSIRS